ncbi:MAG: pyruvate kinase, partial [Candidatus Eisenbacteria bacterium]|nr:pyruvate kinase [Candidatus Eisenbacteria bacterium]
MSQHRLSRIVATLGPASSESSVLRRMISAGVNIFRFNMSHGTHDQHAQMMKRLRAAAEHLSRPVGILVDLQGPKVRTGLNDGGGTILLKRGETIQMSFNSGRGKRQAVSRPGHIIVDSPQLTQDLSAGDHILLDDGRLKLRVEKKTEGKLYAKVLREGLLKEHAGVNVPGPLTSLKAPTLKDGRDAAFAVAQGADFVALSFVQSPDDIRRLKRLLTRRIKQGSAVKMPLIIAKLEKPAALEHLNAILEEVDGVMVARGDLGVELSLEKVPSWQKKILQAARSRSVYTITAT